MASQWLVQKSGPAYIYLLSRSGRVADMTALAALAVSPACVTSIMADAGVNGDVDACLARLGGPPLSALLHASGILQVGSCQM